MTKTSAPTVYFDSSIVLRHAVMDKNSLRNPEDFVANGATSALTRIECFRVLDRWKITREVREEVIVQAWTITREFLAILRTIPISALVVESASQSFPIALKSLDAIHLASALLLRRKSESRITMLTHDTKLALAATAMDLNVIGVTK